jgi:hypothetical protein
MLPWLKKWWPLKHVLPTEYELQNLRESDEIPVTVQDTPI